MLEIIANPFFWGQVLLFLAVIVIFQSGRNLLASQSENTRRLERQNQVHISADGLGLIKDDNALKEFEKFLTPKDENQRSIVRKSLMQAGYRNPSAVRRYYAWRIILSFGAVALAVLILPLIMIGTASPIIFAALLMMLLIAFFAPTFWVERKHQHRRQNIQDNFADVLDLLLVCIEAGHGFDQALSRVVREIEASNPVIADEMNVVVEEMRVGKDRSKIFSDLVARTGVDDIASFINVIKQADKFGVSIADALRVYSNEMRDKRFSRAEAKANMMPVKLALATILFTIPPTILILVGPSLLMVLRQLGGLMS